MQPDQYRFDGAMIAVDPTANAFPGAVSKHNLANDEVSDLERDPLFVKEPQAAFAQLGYLESAIAQDQARPSVAREAQTIPGASFWYLASAHRRNP